MAYSGAPAMYVGTDASGGFQVDTYLSRMAFLTPQPQSVLRGFLSMRENLGKNIGDTVFRNKFGNISTAGAAVAESATIPTDRKYILSQSTATVTEFGNSISATSKLINLANMDMTDPLIQGLINDEKKAIDAYLYTNVYNAAMLRWVGTATDGGALTSDGTATATNTSVLNSYHVRQMVYYLESSNAPKLPTGNYLGIGSLKAIDNLRDDADWKNVQLYKDSYNGLVTNYVGTLHGVDWFAENSAMSGAGVITFTNSSITGKAFVCGAGFGTEDLVIPAEVRSNYSLAKMLGSSSDFGRTLQFAWYEAAAFGTLWNDAAQCHAICWDCA